jgi:DNA-binding SARP family transcriptional activator/tetratricopeptide (TPR) repeat protein
MEFGLLGPVEGWLPDRRLDLGPAKQRLVLAALLLEPNRSIPTERLVDLTWPQSPPASARTAVHGRISRLRGILAAAGAPGHGVELTTEGSGYLLRIDPRRVDAHRFTALLGEAREAATDEQAVGLYDRALLLWRGRPLDGTVPEEVRPQLVGSLEEARLLALEDRADAQLRLGQHRELVDRLTGLLEAHPLRERMAGQLALALYRCDQSGPALEVCRRTRYRLVEELGIDPGPALRDLEVAILRNDESLAPAAVRAAAPAVAPAHLPAEAAGFAGRAAEVRRLTDLLAPGDATVVAVVSGPPGVGKSALAVHCAHRAADRYPDGQLHLDLRGYDPSRPVRPVDALGRFLRALGVPPERIPIDQDEAVPLYRSLLAGRRVLVVLDNAGSAEQVRPLLPGAAGCAVLVTSRDDLRGLTALDGARQLRLDVLPPAESLALLAGMVGADRVAAEPAAAGELARLCAHLPLALRIAGAHLAAHPVQPVEGYAAELAGGNRIGKLAIGEDPRAAVRTAFDLSYRTLAAGERRLFRLLGLVPGPDVSAAAAAAVTGQSPEDAARHLDRLCAAHLVRQHAPDRYLFHDLLRLYAAGRAEAEDTAAERDTALRALLAHYLHTTDAAARLLYPQKVRLPIPPGSAAAFDDGAAALRWLDAELPNLIAAVQHAARAGHPGTACLLADALRGYFTGRGAPEWFTVARAALDAAGGDPLPAAAAGLSLGDAYRCVSRYPHALEHYRAALALARQAGWPEGESTVLSNLGLTYRETGELELAAETLGEALAMDRRLGLRSKEVLNLVHIGVTSALLGRLERAAELFRQALLVDSGATAAAIRHALGTVYRALGRLEEAVVYLGEALAGYRDVDDLSGRVSILDTLAGVHSDAGRYRQAADTAAQSIALARQIGQRRTEAAALNTLGAVRHRQGAQREALGHHRDAHRLAAGTGDRSGQVDALVGMAAAHTGLREYLEGEARAGQALAQARAAGFRMAEGQALSALADVAMARGDAADGARLAREALAVHRETGYRLGAARTLRTLGHALRSTEGPAAATPCWRDALTLLTDIGTSDTEDLRRLTRA